MDEVKESKKPWLSKTLWANAILALVAFLPWDPIQSAISNNPDLVMQIVAGVNIVLRMVTGSKVSLK